MIPRPLNGWIGRLEAAVESMNLGLAKLIADYQQSVRSAVELIRQSDIPLPSSHAEWASTPIPQEGELKGGVPYRKHGFGCLVLLPERNVDFDFGSGGEIDGFDVMRLAEFAGPDLVEYGFQTLDDLIACFHLEVAAGRLVYSEYVLYYLAPRTLAGIERDKAFMAGPSELLVSVMCAHCNDVLFARIPDETAVEGTTSQRACAGGLEHTCIHCGKSFWIRLLPQR